MRHSLRVLLGLGLALGAAGCSDYLSGPGVASTSDPNNVIKLGKPGPLYIGIQEAGPPQREGQLARWAAEYTQQVAGIARQQAAYDRYGAGPNDVDTYFLAVYGAGIGINGGGALLDIHKMLQLARKASDSLYIGIGKVYEALDMGFAADRWGDIPYREAADSTIPQPHFDPQLQIYDDLQHQLDSAITIFLAASGPTNIGGATDGSELVYGGRTSAQLGTVYTAVAHSLKARYYMHVAATDPTAYQKAFTEAQSGISSPADDFLWFHDATPVGQNIWWQFQSQRSGDLGPGAPIINILGRRIAAGVEDSARIKFYFSEVAACVAPTGGTATQVGPVYFGYRPSGNKVLPGGKGSLCVTTAPGQPEPDSTYSFSDFGPFIDGSSEPGDFRQPEITYAETQLIMAEAQWHINCPACAATTVVAQAQPFLDAARANRAYGATGGATVTFPALPNANAPNALPATLQNIIEEKYVTLFLNPEVWNDYKRTCLPSLAPAPASVTATTPGTAPIPGRLPYGQTEINANPNVPTTSSAGVTITSVSLNPNQPTACPVLDYTSSSPLAN